MNSIVNIYVMINIFFINDFSVIMKNPIKFIQEVKQEAFKVSWPTGKETLQGALMVFAMAVLASLFFLLLDQILKFLLDIVLRISI